MELTQLIQFKTIAKYENITRAAEELHISQPGLSAMLRKLEEELDCKLFYRNRNHLELTAAGQIVINHVNTIISEVDGIRAEVAALQRHENEITVFFCSKSVMWYFTPVFSHAYPQIVLETRSFQEGTAADISLLTQEKADILITSKPLASHGIESVPFLTDNHLLSVPKGYFPSLESRSTITEDDLSKISEIHYLDQENDSFCQRFKYYLKENAPGIHVSFYYDYFIYIQNIQHQHTLTISTDLAQHFRNDGANRILIPFDISELKIQFYLNYLKINRQKLQPILNWNKYHL